MDVQASVTDANGKAATATLTVSVAPRVPGCVGTFALPASIDRSGTTDVGPDINTWLASLPDWATADFGGVALRCETAVKVTDRTGLRFLNPVLYRQTLATITTVGTPNIANPHLWLLRGGSHQIDGANVTGCNTVNDQTKPGFATYKTEYEFEAAVRVEQVVTCAVNNLTADAVWGDFLQVANSDNVTAVGATVDRNGRQGVTLIGRNLLVDGWHIGHSRRSAFDIEPNTPAQIVSGIEIRNCESLSVGLPFASAGKGRADNVNIHNNISHGGSVPVLSCAASDGARRSNWTFTDHVSTDLLGSPLAGLQFTNVDGVTVRRVSLLIEATRSGTAFRLSGCGGACEVTDSSWGGANNYKIVTPAPDFSLVQTGNTPVLTAA